MLKRVGLLFLIISCSIIAMNNPNEVNQAKLRKAVSMGNVKSAKELLLRGNVNINGEKILDKAAWNLDIDMLSLLLEHGADPSLRPSLLCDIYQQELYGNKERTKKLKEERTKILKRLIAHPKTNLNCVDHNGVTFADLVRKEDNQELCHEIMKPENMARARDVSTQLMPTPKKRTPYQIDPTFTVNPQTPQKYKQQKTMKSTEPPAQVVPAIIPPAAAGVPIVVPHYPDKPIISDETYLLLSIAKNASPQEILGINKNASEKEKQEAYQKRSAYYRSLFSEVGREGFKLVKWAYDSLKEIK